MLFFRLLRACGELELDVNANGRYFTADTVEELLRQVEQLLIEAAADDMPLTRPEPPAGLLPVPRPSRESRPSPVPSPSRKPRSLPELASPNRPPPTRTAGGGGRRLPDRADRGQ